MPAKKKSPASRPTQQSSYAITILSPDQQARNLLIADIRAASPRQICARIFDDAREALGEQTALIHDYDDEHSPIRRSEARRRADELYRIIDRLTRAHVILAAAAQNEG